MSDSTKSVNVMAVQDEQVQAKEAPSVTNINGHPSSGTVESSLPGGSGVSIPGPEDPSIKTAGGVTVSASSTENANEGQVPATQNAAPGAAKEVKPHNTGMYASKYAPSPPQSADASRAPAFVAKFNNIPRGPRRGGYNGHQSHHQQYDPRDDVRMLETKIREAHQKIDEERKAHEAALAAADTRAQKECEVAVEKLANELLGQKIQLSRKSEDIRKKEQDLEARKDLIRKIEFILTIAQKQFADADAGVDNRSFEDFVNVNEAIIRERVAHEINRRDRKAGAHLITKAEELKIREADLEAREKGYLPMLATNLEQLETKIRSDIEDEITIRVGQGEYQRGFAEGKARGDREPAKENADNAELRELAYDQGYASCFAMFERFKKFQTGELAHDSPEMAFLLDPCHPENPFTRGLQVGRLGGALNSQSLPASSQTDALPARNIPAGTQGRESVRHNKSLSHANGRLNAYGINNFGLRGPQEVMNADSTSGVPQFGTRTEDSPSSFNETPPTSKTTTTTGSKNTVEDGEPSHVQVPNFAGRALFTSRVSADEQVHKEDEQVVLIDLY